MKSCEFLDLLLVSQQVICFMEMVKNVIKNNICSFLGDLSSRAISRVGILLWG
jgi:hypothetical protein